MQSLQRLTDNDRHTGDGNSNDGPNDRRNSKYVRHPEIADPPKCKDSTNQPSQNGGTQFSGSSSSGCADDKRGSMYNVGRSYHLSSYDLDACVFPPSNDLMFRLNGDGVYRVYDGNDQEYLKPLYDGPLIKDFYQDLEFLLGVMGDGPTKTLSFKRLKYLDSSFSMHVLLNEAKEIQEQKVSSPCSILKIFCRS